MNTEGLLHITEWPNCRSSDGQTKDLFDSNTKDLFDGQIELRLKLWMAEAQQTGNR